jgi:predicted permease
MNAEIILKATIFLAAFASFVLSVTLYFKAGDDTAARLNGIYAGIWVPSILSLGALIAAGKREKGE